MGQELALVMTLTVVLPRSCLTQATRHAITGNFKVVPRRQGWRNVLPTRRCASN